MSTNTFIVNSGQYELIVNQSKISVNVSKSKLMSIELQEVATTEVNWQLADAELGTAQPKLVFLFFCQGQLKLQL